MDEYSTVCFLLIGGPKQNAVSLLTLISDTVYALSHESLGYAFHRSFFNNFLIDKFSISESLK